MAGEPESGTTAAPAPGIEAGATAGLAGLLAEVKRLAVRIRQLESTAPDWAGVPSGGQHLMRLLNQDGPQTLPEMARRRGTSRQNIRIIANQLARKGCVRITRYAADKRCALVELTEHGRTLAQTAGSSEERLAGGIGESVSVEEARSAARLLRRIRERLVELEDSLLVSGSSKTRPDGREAQGGRAQAATKLSRPASEAEVSAEELPVSLL